MEPLLREAARQGDLLAVNEILAHHPDVNVNYCPEWLFSPLQYAVRGGHYDVVRVLLEHPGIDVNHCRKGEWPPFMTSCFPSREDQLDIMELLLADKRVDINYNCCGSSALWKAAVMGQLETIRRLIASGRTLDCELKGSIGRGPPTTTPLQIATEQGHAKVAELLRNFRSHPTLTRFSVRFDLGRVDVAPLLFAAIVFVCDGFFSVRSLNESGRFLHLAQKLPIELQMTLCHRAIGSAACIIPSRDSNPAFKILVILLLCE